jgi:ubiquinol-cytochrome c reductase cytochrome b subunit
MAENENVSPESQAAQHPEKELEEGEPFFPDHILSNLMVIFLTLGLLITFTTFFPAPMEEKADPFLTPDHIKPEWYFLFAYQILKLAETLSFLGQWAPKLLGLLGPGLLVVVLLLVPFLDKSKERHPRKRPLAVIVGILGIVFFIALTIWGHYS